MNINNVIKGPVITEKSTQLAGGKTAKYTFLVDKKATKPEIREALKMFLAVDVTNICTMINPGKEKRVTSKVRRTSRRPSYKKAIATFKEGQKLDLFGGK